MSDILNFVLKIYTEYGITGIFAMLGWIVGAGGVYLVHLLHKNAQKIQREMHEAESARADARMRQMAEEAERWRKTIEANDTVTKAAVDQIVHGIEILSERMNSNQNLLVQAITLLRR